MSASQDSPAPGAGEAKSRRVRNHKEPNPDARMPLIEHIRELRNRVLKSIAVNNDGQTLGPGSPNQRAQRQVIGDGLRLSGLHPEDQDAYYDIKDPVFDVIMAGAEDWATQTGWSTPPSD